MLPLGSVTIKSHKQSLSSQVGLQIPSWVENVHIQVKCLAQGYGSTPQRPIFKPGVGRSKLSVHSCRATTSCIYRVYSLDIGTLKAVTGLREE